MTYQQSPGRPPNQATIDLIYKIKGLAEIVEKYRDEISDQLERESRDRERELDRLRDLVTKNGQAIAVLPITVSDRLEKLISRLETNLDSKIGNTLDDVLDTLQDVKDKLTELIHTKSSEDSDKCDDTASKFEVLHDGTLNVILQSGWFVKAIKGAKYAVVTLAAGGGVVGVKEILSSIFGW